MNPALQQQEDTITALATPPGAGAIAVIRLSGKEAIPICNRVFDQKNLKEKNLAGALSHSIHFGVIHDGDVIVDEVLVSLFKGPNSYTGEDVIEISCHGSQYIQQQILQLLCREGARMAEAGEFTLRGFMDGKFDLSQAEAVADLIASNSASSHQVAMMQMRGGFSSKIKTLRESLINFASLLELELDFSEEDVEFADRKDLRQLIDTIHKIIDRLIDSYEVGNVIKNGIPVAIVGKPNAGKSTLLNALTEEDAAIVSDIPGTTRDAIENEISIGGVLFRFIDTAGIRDTDDTIESIGVSKTFEKIKKSAIILYMFDVNELTSTELKNKVEELRESIGDNQLVLVANQIDKADLEYTKDEFGEFSNIIFLSAKENINIDILKSHLVALFDARAVNIPETVVTSARHVDLLKKAEISIVKVLEGLDQQISSELLATDVKTALYHLGEITGEVSTDDLLGNIFSKFLYWEVVVRLVAKHKYVLS